MKLESALRASSLGIMGHGEAISVVGDNIANVSTTGFRQSRAEFSDIVADGARGGQTYATPQAGNGVSVELVRTIHTAGTLEATGRTLDIGISGEGFFVVGDIDSPSYSRAGALSLDADGVLVTSQGEPVLGFAEGAEIGEGEAGLSQLSVTDVGTSATATTEMSLVGNIQSTLPAVDIPAQIPTTADLAAAASYQATVSVVDSLGEDHLVRVGFFKTDTLTWSAQAFVDGSKVGQEEGTLVPVSGAFPLNYTENGLLAEGQDGILALDIPFANGAAASQVALDLSGFTQNASTSATISTTSNGVPISPIAGYGIGEDGTLSILFENGSESALGRLALADFINVDGLERAGDTKFIQGSATGERTLGSPGEGKFGVVQSGFLERSTVDITEEFVDLVTFQRGYQANSQTFSTTSELIQQTIQLIR